MDRHALPAQVLEALRRGNKIEAIKLLREATQVGLAEAKGVIDALDARANPGRAPTASPPPAKKVVTQAPPRRPRVDDLGPGEVPRTSLGPVVIAIVLAIVAFSIWVFTKG